MGKVSQQQILTLLFNKQPIFQTEAGWVWYSTITNQRLSLNSADIGEVLSEGFAVLTPEASIRITDAGIRHITPKHWHSSLPVGPEKRS